MTIELALKKLPFDAKKTEVDVYQCDGGNTDPFWVIADEKLERLTIVYCYGAYSYQWSGGNGGLTPFINRCNDQYLLMNLMGKEASGRAQGPAFFKAKIWPLVRKLFAELNEYQSVKHLVES